MNILFFLKPKSELAYIYDYHTLRQAMEIMEYHKYSSVPIIDREGKYIGTNTRGDLLWGLKELNILNIKDAKYSNFFIFNIFNSFSPQRRSPSVIVPMYFPSRLMIGTEEYL